MNTLQGVFVLPAVLVAGTDYSSCNLLSASIYSFIFPEHLENLFSLFELAKNCLKLGALSLMNRMHLGVSRKKYAKPLGRLGRNFCSFTLWFLSLFEKLANLFNPKLYVSLPILQYLESTCF